MDVGGADALEGVEEGAVADLPAAEGVDQSFGAVWSGGVEEGVGEVGQLCGHEVGPRSQEIYLVAVFVVQGKGQAVVELLGCCVVCAASVT